MFSITRKHHTRTHTTTHTIHNSTIQPYANYPNKHNHTYIIATLIWARDEFPIYFVNSLWDHAGNSVFESLCDCVYGGALDCVLCVFRTIPRFSFRSSMRADLTEGLRHITHIYFGWRNPCGVSTGAILRQYRERFHNTLSTMGEYMCWIVCVTRIDKWNNISNNKKGPTTKSVSLSIIHPARCEEARAVKPECIFGEPHSLYTETEPIAHIPVRRHTRDITSLLVAHNPLRIRP